MFHTTLDMFHCTVLLCVFRLRFNMCFSSGEHLFHCAGSTLGLTSLPAQLVQLPPQLPHYLLTCSAVSWVCLMSRLMKLCWGPLDSLASDITYVESEEAPCCCWGMLLWWGCLKGPCFVEGPLHCCECQICLRTCSAHWPFPDCTVSACNVFHAPPYNIRKITLCYYSASSFIMSCCSSLFLVWLWYSVLSVPNLPNHTTLFNAFDISRQTWSTIGVLVWWLFLTSNLSHSDGLQNTTDFWHCLLKWGPLGKGVTQNTLSMTQQNHH